MNDPALLICEANGCSNPVSWSPSEYCDDHACSVNGCANKSRSKRSGLCGTHYARLRVFKDLHEDVPIGKLKPSAKVGCDEPGCPNPHHAHGLCQRHWSIQDRIMNYGQQKGLKRPKGGFK